MKPKFYLLLLFIALVSCNQGLSTYVPTRTEALVAENYNASIQDTGRVTFQTIEQVVQNNKGNAWVEFKDSTASLALHFESEDKDTLAVSYSSECWLYYPYRLENGRIIVYWDKLIDSKYSDFEILQAIRKTTKKYNGKPFMVLELATDTTLKATYLIPDLVKKINSSSKERVFFPEKFTVSQEFYL